MGTYFADQEQIARLRLRNRVEAQDAVSEPRISTAAALDLAAPPRYQEALSGKGDE